LGEDVVFAFFAAEEEEVGVVEGGGGGGGPGWAREAVGRRQARAARAKAWRRVGAATGMVETLKGIDVKITNDLLMGEVGGEGGGR